MPPLTPRQNWHRAIEYGLVDLTPIGHRGFLITNYLSVNSIEEIRNQHLTEEEVKQLVRGPIRSLGGDFE